MMTGQIILARWTGLTSVNGSVAAPGNGSTITIFDSGTTVAGQQYSSMDAIGVNWKRVIMTSVSSHDSGASGVVFQASFDDGTNWDTIVSYTDTAAGAPNIHYVALSVPRWRVRYTNSANVLTSWRGNLVGDEFDRSTQ